MAQLHNRMLVILGAEHFDGWMTGAKDEVGQLLVPCPSDWLDANAISRRVNSPRNDNADLLEPAA